MGFPKSRKEPVLGRRKRKAAESTEPAPIQLPLTKEQNLLRRVLLGLVTALVVARPLVPGEDPGRLLITTGVADLVFTSLWLVVAVGYGVFRAWAGRGAWYGSLVEAGLLGLAAVSFASVQRAAYQHPAWLVACQWATLLLAFCLVRQLVRSPAENRALLAALLATGVSLSVQAIYQSRVMVAPVAPEALFAEINDLPTVPPAPPPGVAGTFSEPATFAAFLALLVPALAGLWLACRRRDDWSWRTGLITVCFLLLLGGMFQTHGWFALLAVLVVGLAGCALAARRVSLPLVGLLGAGLLGLGTFVVVRAGPAELQQAFQDRLVYWDASSRIVRENLLLGVGAGNLGRELPGKVVAPSVPPTSQPDNFLFEVAATFGLVGLALLLVTLAAFFWRVFSSPDEPVEEEAPRAAWIPWEFYLGGVAGLSLGFVMHYAAAGGQNAVIEALVALVRALVWFGAFALLESVPWSGRGRALGLAAGVAAALVALLFEGGISFPALAQPLWIMAALALNALPDEEPVWIPGHWVSNVLPAPILAVVALIYLILMLYPQAAASSAVAEARGYYPIWQDRYEERWKRDLVDANTAGKRIEVTNRAEAYVKELFLNRFGRAVDEDSGNAPYHAELAYWYGKQWQLHSDIGKVPNQDVEIRLKLEQKDFYDAATREARRAQELDPKGKEGYWAMYLLCNQFAKAEMGAGQKTQFRFAANNLTHLVEHDPNDARLRYLLAEALLRAGDSVQGKFHALRAEELDDVAGTGRRKLTGPQREQIQKWLSETPGT